MSDIKVLIAAHREFCFPENSDFLPIQVGCALSENKLNMQGDDVGEHISERNPNYAELTALYWAWKNLRDVDFVGLCHYRRYFSSAHSFQHSIFIGEDEFPGVISSLRLPDYKRLLNKFDIIKPKPFTYYHSVESVLSNILSMTDLRILEGFIKESYPDYYSTYLEYMRYNNKISSCNMFICGYSLFKEYCSWLFPLLFELERRVQISPYPVEARIFGFLAEALFDVYCINNKLKVKYLPIYVARDDVVRDNDLIFLLKNIRRNISFFFNKPHRPKAV